MKNNFRNLVFYILIALFTITPNIACVAYDSPSVTIPDSHLETGLREILKKPHGDINEYDLGKLRTLDLRNMGIISLEGLQYCRKLKEIDLTGNFRIENFYPLLDIGDLEIRFDVWVDDTMLDAEIRRQVGKSEGPLSPYDLAQVRILNDAEHGFRKIKYPELFTGLEELRLNWKEGYYCQGITDLQSIERMHSLKTLYLGGLSLFSNDNPNDNVVPSEDSGEEFYLDLSPLSNLTNLTRLGIYNQKFIDAVNPDLSPLAGITGLTELDITLNSDFDLTPLSDLKNLKVLRLNENRISDIYPLSSLKNLRVLEIRNGKITSINAISNLSRLEELDLECIYGGYGPYNLSPLEGLSNLRILRLSGRADGHGSLSKLTNLEELTLTETDIIDLKPIKNLNKLVSLKLWGNFRLKYFKTLGEMDGLESLEIFDLCEPELDFLSGHANLKKLNIWFDYDIRDEIKDLTPIWNLAGLEDLTIGNTPIFDLKPILNLTDLKKLHLTHCTLDDIGVLEKLPNLESLTIDYDFGTISPENSDLTFENIPEVIIPSLKIIRKSGN
ncbi:MAG: leucine-rich repeat domain-containing protein [bacterium]